MWNDEPLQLTSDSFSFDYCDRDSDRTGIYGPDKPAIYLSLNEISPAPVAFDLAMEDASMGQATPSAKPSFPTHKSLSITRLVGKKTGLGKRKKKSPLATISHTCTGDVCGGCNRSSGGEFLDGSIPVRGLRKRRVIKLEAP